MTDTVVGSDNAVNFNLTPRVTRPAIANDATELIGNTPAGAICRGLRRRHPGTLVGKLESFIRGFRSRTASACSMIEDAERRDASSPA